MAMPPITVGDLLMWLIQVRDREGAETPVFFECFAGVTAHQEPLTTWRLSHTGRGETAVVLGNANLRLHHVYPRYDTGRGETETQE